MRRRLGSDRPLVFVGVRVLVMQLDLRLRRFVGVMFGLPVVRVGEMGVVGARLMIALGQMRGGLAMVFCGMLVMFRCLLMMLGRDFGMGHGRLP